MTTTDFIRRNNVTRRAVLLTSLPLLYIWYFAVAATEGVKSGWDLFAGNFKYYGKEIRGVFTRNWLSPRDQIAMGMRELRHRPWGSNAIVRERFAKSIAEYSKRRVDQ